MTSQALNSINLYRGNDSEKIKMLLRIQRSSVVDELKSHFNASSIDDLAFKLSIS